MQNCSICQNPQRREIDHRLVSGASCASVAREFSVSVNSLHNHLASHITRQLTTALAHKQTEEDFNLLEKIDTMLGLGQVIFQRNFDKEADVTALKALDSQRNTISLLVQVSAQLHASKEADLAILRLQSTEGSEEDQETYAEALTFLSTPELRVFQSLLLKLENKTHEDVLGEYLSSIANFEVITDDEFQPTISKAIYPSERNKLKRTTTVLPKAPMLIVRPIEPTRIPCSEDL